MTALTGKSERSKLAAMVDALLDNFRLILIGGILLVVGLGQVSRIVSSILGLAFWVLVGVLGALVYARGGAVGLASFAFPAAAFYALCGLMAVFNVFALRQALARRRAQRRPTSASAPSSAEGD